MTVALELEKACLLDAVMETKVENAEPCCDGTRPACRQGVMSSRGGGTGCWRRQRDLARTQQRRAGTECTAAVQQATVRE